MTATLEGACQELAATLGGAVACGVVDLDQGGLCAIWSAVQYNRTLDELSAAATLDLFCGPAVTRMEALVRAHRGLPDDGERYFQEIQITSRHTYHFAKAVRSGRAALVVVTSRDASVGMCWARLRAAVPAFEQLLEVRDAASAGLPALPPETPDNDKE
jgi:hypothetical protein